MKQKGFVLVSVLVITTISTMLAFSQFRDNHLQERMAGNHHKGISARHAAEQGVFDAFKVIEKGGTTEEMIIKLNALVTENKDYSFPSLDSDGNIIVLVSTGEVGNAIAYLKAILKTSEKSAEGIFDNAVVACESLTLKGQGSIDSYSGGLYSESTSDSNGDVSVKGGSKNVSLKGKGKIKGAISEYTGECDPLVIADSADEDGDPVLGEISLIAQQLGDDYDFNKFETTKDSTNTFDGSIVDRFIPETLDILGESTDVYVFDDFKSTKDNTIKISGDITFYIQGDMNIQKTNFTLVGDSSLTIYIAGKINIKNDSNVFTDNHVSSALTLYSSSDSSDAVKLQGDADIYMNLYIPNGKVKYSGKGDIMGAIRAKEVDMSGQGNIHYDEGLADLETSGNGEAKISYCALYYYYPKDNETPEILDAAAYSDYCEGTVEDVDDGDDKDKKDKDKKDKDKKDKDKKD